MRYSIEYEVFQGENLLTLPSKIELKAKNKKQAIEKFGRIIKKSVQDGETITIIIISIKEY